MNRHSIDIMDEFGRFRNQVCCEKPGFESDQTRSQDFEMIECVFKKVRALCTRDQSSEGFGHRHRVNSVGSSTPHVSFF